MRPAGFELEVLVVGILGMLPYRCHVLMNYVFRLAKAQVPLPYVLFAKKGSSEGRRHIHTFLILLPFSLQAMSALSVCVCVCVYVPVYTHTYTHRQTFVCVCVCIYKSIHMSCFPSLYGLEAISFDQLQHSLGDYCSNGKAC